MIRIIGRAHHNVELGYHNRKHINAGCRVGHDAQDARDGLQFHDTRPDFVWFRQRAYLLR